MLLLSTLRFGRLAESLTRALLSFVSWSVLLLPPVPFLSHSSACISGPCLYRSEVFEATGMQDENPLAQLFPFLGLSTFTIRPLVPSCIILFISYLYRRGCGVSFGERRAEEEPLPLCLLSLFHRLTFLPCLPLWSFLLWLTYIEEVVSFLR